MATLTSNKYLYWIIGAVIVLAVAIGLPWSFGYRIQGGSLKAPGTIVLAMPVAGVTVYVDGKEKVTSTKDNETLSFSVPASAHTILLGKQGFWPWKKEIAVSSGVATHLHPFMLSQTVSGSAIGTNDPEYRKILNSVKASAIPGPTTKKISGDGTTAVWVQDGALFAEWVATSTQPEYFCSANGVGNCDKTVKVMTLTAVPTSIDFYKDRADVILLSVADTLSAVELDTRGTQNFQPLYKGGTPAFVKNPKAPTLFVYDGASLMEISE